MVVRKRVVAQPAVEKVGAAEDDPFAPDVAAPTSAGAAPTKPVAVPPAGLAKSVTELPAGPQPVDFVGEAASPWGTVVEDVASLDVDVVYAKLRDELSLGDGVAHVAEVRAALDVADSNSFLAVRLARKAKLYEEAEAREVQAGLEVLRSEARVALEKEKEEGVRKKAITIQDVEDYVRARWPQQSRELEERHGRARAARAVAEGLSAAWQSRAASLRALLDSR